MKIFLDTANLELIKKYAAWGIVDGVTTNPTWIANEWVSLEKRIKEIREIVDGPISAETISTEAEGIIKEAREIHSWWKDIWVKIPAIPEWLKAMKTIYEEGIKTNITLVFSTTQALLFAKAGATVVSPFIGRYSEMWGDGIQLVADILAIYENYGLETGVLSCSFRTLDQIKDVAVLGTDIVTVNPTFLDQMVTHKMTDQWLEKFLADWETVKDKQ